LRAAAAVAFVLLAAAAARPSDDLAIRKALLDAAAANDLGRFDAAIERAETFIDTIPVGARRNAFRRVILTASDISRVWHFAQTDARGLYYDDERLPFYYEHLASDHPGYARFIAEYRVVDRTGLPQYPTRETRSFLLKRLVNTGRKSP
jgi:DNA-binding GntR family transcriptional regulator